MKIYLSILGFAASLKDIMPDLLHPDAKGYEIWANAITPVVEKYFPGQLGPGAAAPAPPAGK